jgi:hypothetical protein
MVVPLLKSDHSLVFGAGVCPPGGYSVPACWVSSKRDILDASNAPVAQWIECRPPEPETRVRPSPGAPPSSLFPAPFSPYDFRIIIPE